MKQCNKRKLRKIYFVWRHRRLIDKAIKFAKSEGNKARLLYSPKYNEPIKELSKLARVEIGYSDATPTTDIIYYIVNVFKKTIKRKNGAFFMLNPKILNENCNIGS